MYGLQSAAAIRYSTRCDFSEPGITRKAQVRFSTPQVASVGAQKPGIRREYEFTVLAIIASTSGISCCCPPMNQRILSEILCGFFASWKTDLPSLPFSEIWIWPDWPG